MYIYIKHLYIYSFVEKPRVFPCSHANILVINLLSEGNYAVSKNLLITIIDYTYLSYPQNVVLKILKELLLLLYKIQL